MGTRPERVQEALRREISMIVQKEIKDPRLGFITVTKVEITKDLKNAYVYYSVLGKDKDANNAKHALQSAAGFIRKLVGDRISMRYVPAITFRQDKSLEHTKRIYEILDNIKKETQKRKE
ncbi:MAG: 30S ribosome-binding factor RbfA [Candidatus Omnitrophota bacterium]